MRSHGDYRRSSSTAQIRKSGSPGVMWMFPTTLFTRTRPARLQPSDDCSWIWSDQCSSMHYALSESARDVKERKARSTPGQSLVNRITTAGAQPSRTYASQTASHELQDLSSGVVCRSTNHSNRTHAARSTCSCRHGAHRSSSQVQPYPQSRRVVTTLCVIQCHVGARRLYLSSREIIRGKSRR